LLNRGRLKWNSTGTNISEAQDRKKESQKSVNSKLSKKATKVQEVTILVGSCQGDHRKGAKMGDQEKVLLFARRDADSNGYGGWDVEKEDDSENMGVPRRPGKNGNLTGGYLDKELQKLRAGNGLASKIRRVWRRRPGKITMKK